MDPIAAKRNPTRRQVTRWLASLPLLSLSTGLLVPLVGHAATLRPTPTDDLGPFYPLDWDGDIDGDLTRLTGSGKLAATGQRLRLGGVLRDTNGRPIVDAAIEIWQADAKGRYRHPGVDPATRDPAFQGYGRVMTDAEGRYDFLTIMPGNYGSRPPHVHFRIAQPGRPEFVTQMYFRGNNREGNGYAPPEREALTVDVVADRATASGGALAARFDLVLAAR